MLAGQIRRSSISSETRKRSKRCRFLHVELFRLTILSVQRLLSVIHGYRSIRAVFGAHMQGAVEILCTRQEVNRLLQW